MSSSEVEKREKLLQASPGGRQPEGKRVAYLVSPDLIRSSDALVCHPGRSSCVHSLVYHLGLLDPAETSEQPVKESSNSSSCASSDGGEESELAELKRMLDPDASYIFPEQGSKPSEHRRAKLVISPLASDEQLMAFHDTCYVKALLGEASLKGDTSEGHEANSALASPTKRPRFDTKSKANVQSQSKRESQFGLEDDCPRFPLLAQHVRTVAGATIHAADLLANHQADVTIVWDGGRHHAHRSKAAGFCYVNDIVLGILALKRPRKVPQSRNVGSGSRKQKTILTRFERVLYLDLDLHWGDGVEQAFYSSSSVLTLSVHHHAQGFFPCRDTRESANGSFQVSSGPESAPAHALSLPLRPGATSETLSAVYASCIDPIIETFEPQAIVVQCGTDGAAGDPHGVWNLCSAGYLDVIGRILKRDKATLLLGGGGYDSPNAARVWAGVTSLALQHGENKDLESIRFELLAKKVPDQTFWSEMSGNDSLKVHAGEMKNENDEQYLQQLADRFEHYKSLLTKWRQERK
ncbi:Arginase/deacetylase [Tilletiaria anomala UBC 951]|uniref:histone deacetylase n=1 Tax=Tilletiaria anomala (strain ATCC 24038 / CBS 436.72 / UBC 951) TaxID=1037660 RepID=A0A066W0Q2_TILAU|nr:Arginase/deacetylase [Tilletiaria anomala UBC 951]KDN47552.1 Arginase/deacetylase [Tilletiaria anomala UBC 951]